MIHDLPAIIRHLSEEHPQRSSEAVIQAQTLTLIPLSSRTVVSEMQNHSSFSYDPKFGELVVTN